MKKLNQFVSCLYDLYHVPVGPDPDLTRLSLTTRLKNLQWLLESDIPLMLFVDPALAEHVSTVPENVQVILLPLEQLPTYQKIMKQTLALPENRNVKKDRQEYFALMNSKLDFIRMAANITPAENYIWIDCAIFKLYDHKDQAQALLRMWNQITPTEQIISPAGWEVVHGALVVDNPNWRFLGSILSIPETQFDKFLECCQNVLHAHMQQNQITWEINYWAQVEHLHPDWFNLYFGNGSNFGNHDITMLQRPDLIK